MPFEIPESWVWTTLGDCLSLSSGTNIKVRESAIKGRFPVYGGNGINGYYDQYNVSNKTIVIGRVGFYCGSVHLTNTESWVTDNALIVSHDNMCDTSFLYYSLIWHNLSKTSNSTAQPVVSQKGILPLKTPIPPMSEQKRIVSAIEKYYKVIDSFEKDSVCLRHEISSLKSKILDLAISGKLVPQDPNDEPAIELLNRINPNFVPCDNSHYEKLPNGWCLAKIKDTFVINPRNKATDDVVAGFVPMTLIDEGYSNRFSYEERTWGTIKTGYTHFANGDVAVARISPCLENRKSVVLRDLPNGIGAGTTELHIFRSSVVMPEYALYFFKSEYFIGKCIGTFNGVVGQQRVSKNIIEEIHIPIPPINEQIKIVSKIEMILAQLDTITAELQ